MKTKIRLYLLVFLFLFLTLVTISDSFALFETDTFGTTQMPIGKWQIKLNDNLITTGISQTLQVDDFIYGENENIQDGYIAPGRNGYFDIILDPGNTEVAIRYDITLNLENNYQESINFDVTPLSGDSTIKTGPNTYSGIINLSEIEMGNNIAIRINITWEDIREFDMQDTELGLVQDNKISIPVNVQVNQYLGEQIDEYIEPETE